MRRECRKRFPCTPGSLNSGFLGSRWWENVPDIPGACATRNCAYLVSGPWLSATMAFLNTCSCQRWTSGRQLRNQSMPSNGLTLYEKRWCFENKWCFDDIRTKCAGLGISIYIDSLQKQNIPTSLDRSISPSLVLCNIIVRTYPYRFYWNIQSANITRVLLCAVLIR